MEIPRASRVPWLFASFCLLGAVAAWLWHVQTDRVVASPSPAGSATEVQADSSLAVSPLPSDVVLEATESAGVGRDPEIQPSTNEDGAAPARKFDVDLPRVLRGLEAFDRSRSYDTAYGLLIATIEAELDAQGRFEDVTGKWDEIDPKDGHRLLRYPKHDPEIGFLDTTDPRGTRWYRFTRADCPEWWALVHPEPGSVTGRQDSIAEPRKVASELADAIRARAAAAIERYRDP